MIERLHPKHETLTAGEWRQTQAKIDELVDAVNALSTTLEEVEDHLYYGLEDDDDIGFTEDALNEDDGYWGDSLCHCGDVEEPHHHTSPAIKSTEESKAAILLNDLVDYCRRHPELRFWQALRSFSGYNYIYGSHHGEADIFDGGITAQRFISQLEDTYLQADQRGG